MQQQLISAVADMESLKNELQDIMNELQVE
jgi:hypothetical protein